MTKFLRVRKVPTRNREPHRVPQKTIALFVSSQPVQDTGCQVQVSTANGLRAELSIDTRTPALLPGSARDIALMLRRWLKNQYGTIVHIVAAGGDAKIRYHRKLRRMVKEINRVLFGIVPQAA